MRICSKFFSPHFLRLWEMFVCKICLKKCCTFFCLKGQMTTNLKKSSISEVKMTYDIFVEDAGKRKARYRSWAVFSIYLLEIHKIYRGVVHGEIAVKSYKFEFSIPKNIKWVCFQNYHEFWKVKSTLKTNCSTKTHRVHASFYLESKF